MEALEKYQISSFSQGVRQKGLATFYQQQRHIQEDHNKIHQLILEQNISIHKKSFHFKQKKQKTQIVKLSIHKQNQKTSIHLNLKGKDKIKLKQNQISQKKVKAVRHTEKTFKKHPISYYNVLQSENRYLPVIEGATNIEIRQRHKQSKSFFKQVQNIKIKNCSFNGQLEVNKNQKNVNESSSVQGLIRKGSPFKRLSNQKLFPKLTRNSSNKMQTKNNEKKLESSNSGLNENQYSKEFMNKIKKSAYLFPIINQKPIGAYVPVNMKQIRQTLNMNSAEKIYGKQ